jgi:hypothetical protein
MQVYQYSSDKLSLYEKYKEQVPDGVGKDVFMDCLRLLCVQTKQQVGLSDRYTDWIRLTAETRKVFELLDTILEDWNLFDMSSELQLLKGAFDRSIEYMKYTYRKEVQQSSINVYLCMHHALGKEDCEHSHEAPACAAHDYFNFMPELIAFIQKVLENYTPAEHNRRLKAKLDNAFSGLMVLGQQEWLRFPRHIIRAICQNIAIDSLKRNLKPGQMLIVMDYKQKILPDSSEASQADWFARAGMSLLGAWLIWVDADGKETQFHFLDMIPSNVHVQNAENLMVALEQLLQYISETFLNIKEVFVQSDNASNFSNILLQAFILVLNSSKRLPQIVRWIYTGK